MQKEEFIKTTFKCKVIAVSISLNIYDGKEKDIILNPGYTNEDYINFLKKLEFDYDSGYGGQELFGTIFCEDGIWFNRGEYDGSEWWEKKQYPKLENYFDKNIIKNYYRGKKLKNILYED